MQPCPARGATLGSDTKALRSAARIHVTLRERCSKKIKCRSFIKPCFSRKCQVCEAEMGRSIGKHDAWDYDVVYLDSRSVPHGQASLKLLCTASLLSRHNAIQTYFLAVVTNGKATVKLSGRSWAPARCLQFGTHWGYIGVQTAKEILSSLLKHAMRLTFILDCSTLYTSFLLRRAVLCKYATVSSTLFWNMSPPSEAPGTKQPPAVLRSRSTLASGMTTRS